MWEWRGLVGPSWHVTVGMSVGTELLMGQDSSVGPTVNQIFTTLPLKLSFGVLKTSFWLHSVFGFITQNTKKWVKEILPNRVCLCGAHYFWVMSYQNWDMSDENRGVQTPPYLFNSTVILINQLFFLGGIIIGLYYNVMWCTFV